jgi:hypothetical protein
MNSCYTYLGGVCLGFFQLSTEKSQQIETNGWLLKQALPKPKQVIDRNREAPIEMLPAASALAAESFSGSAHFV